MKGERMRDSRQPLSIVCFGDSLTAGYQSPTRDAPVIRETPYGAFLNERLRGTAAVRVSGVCGELTSEMVARFHREVVATAPDYAVILGGTNDLGWNVPPSAIRGNLVAMYEAALKGGIRPVAVTVPSLRVEGDSAGFAEDWVQDAVSRREVLNRLIQEFCDPKGVPVVDLFGETAEPGTRFLVGRYSNDGLHLTTEGYRLLADLLYDRIFKHVAP
jgi:lysophospholipase L1-like esterase